MSGAKVGLGHNAGLPGWLALSLTAVQVMGCGASSAAKARSGTFYSTVPCSDACGNDTACMGSCVHADNQHPLPLGMQQLPTR